MSMDHALADVLEHDPAVAYALDRSGTIAYVNPSWDRFAGANGGEPSVLGERVVGTRFLDHVAGDEIRLFYQGLLHGLLEHPREGAVRGVEVEGECNSPTTYRQLVTRFEPLVAAGGATDGVVAISTVVAEAPIASRHPPADPDEVRFREASGQIAQCAWCRRVRVPAGAPRLWLFVPAYVARPPERISHGICELCRRLYCPQPAPPSTGVRPSRSGGDR